MRLEFSKDEINEMVRNQLKAWKASAEASQNE
jgi:hypothetical protein